jgi:hypothetical protein
MRRLATVPVGRSRRRLKLASQGGWACEWKSGTTCEVFDQCGTLRNILVDDELFVIRGDEKNHCVCGYRDRRLFRILTGLISDIVYKCESCKNILSNSVVRRITCTPYHHPLHVIYT